ncbi:non-specific lipid-transfer protein 2-like [Primulina eburnea]|uniref:non-specific lipid-transfer protein 2-like n=1 Tax=Primulina eburnea TaxID=1245227 RepID=UPI003C6C6F0D
MAMKCMCMLLVVLALVSLAPGGEGALGCGNVVSYLNGCIPYVTGQGPLGGCCGGVKGLYSAAKTPADRRTVCTCLKSVANAYAPYIGKAASLPKLCGVSIPYKISPSTDCAKVN